MSTENKGLIIIPYAYGGVTGASIQNVGRQMETYMKNICTAALSARHHAGEDTDVVVVSNIDIPHPYVELLIKGGVKIEECPFDRFNFGREPKYVSPIRWQLAFYKLCALAHCVEKFKYDAFCFMDTDVYVQRSFSKIWTDARDRILLYDLNEPIDGYMVKEMHEFLKNERFLSHYGGEFFAASKDLTIRFVEEAQNVYHEILCAGFITESGDEFITSIVADRLHCFVKSAGAYIRRYWTGSYRLVCNDFDKNNIVILHVPAEKEQGIIKLYDRYISMGKIPPNKVAWFILHLKHPSLRARSGAILRRLRLIR